MSDDIGKVFLLKFGEKNKPRRGEIKFAFRGVNQFAFNAVKIGCKQIKQVTQNAEWNTSKQHKLKMQVGGIVSRLLESTCQNNLVFTAVEVRASATAPLEVVY